MNLGYVFAHGDGVLVSVFMLLIGMSLLSWYLIFWKAWKLNYQQKILQRFNKAHAKRHDWPLHLTQETNAKGSVAFILKKAREIHPALSGLTSGDRRSLLTMHLVQTLDSNRLWLDKGLNVLASIGSSAPFIGLFGTVWGIYGALAEIATAGDASLSVVAGPMGEALVATAVGLFTAIPAVLAYNTFVRTNRVLVQDLRHVAEQLTAYLSLENAPEAPSATDDDKDKKVRLVDGGAR